MTLSDSAFKAQDYQGLVMRGCIILLAEVGPGTPQGVALAPDQTVRCQVLDWYSRKHSRVVRSTYAAELLSVLDTAGQGNLVTTAINELLLGVTTPSQLLARKKREIEHDAGVDARAVFDGITAECPKTPADTPRSYTHLRCVST